MYLLHGSIWSFSHLDFNCAENQNDDDRGQETHEGFVGLECKRVNVAFCRSFAFNGDSKDAETYRIL
jgi:hypothetical protein